MQYISILYYPTLLSYCQRVSESVNDKNAKQKKRLLQYTTAAFHKTPYLQKCFQAFDIFLFPAEISLRRCDRFGSACPCVIEILCKLNDAVVCSLDEHFCDIASCPVTSELHSYSCPCHHT